MDLETENRIAAILMKEAAELRRQADKEGVHAYLRQPSSRFRPNSRFLTATVLGVQQANRAVEVNEMWSVRQKELELDDRNKGGAGDGRSSGRRHGGSVNPEKNTSKRPYVEPTASGCNSGSCRSGYSSSKRAIQECYLSEDEGVKDDDIDEFLHSRVKRGRGAVGTRMDEPGPYLPTEYESSNTERWGRHKVILGPEKPRSLKFSNYDEEDALFQDKYKKGNKVGSSKKHSKSKEKSKDKKKKKKRKDEKRSKRHS